MECFQTHNTPNMVQKNSNTNTIHYNADKLKELRNIECTIKRKVRKNIFRCRIWKPTTDKLGVTQQSSLHNIKQANFEEV